MAPPASKRRKTTHLDSGQESDGASFASFGGSDDAADEVETDGEEQELVSDDGMDSGLGNLSEEQSEDGDDGEEDAVPDNDKSGLEAQHSKQMQQKKADRPHSRSNASTIDAGSSAYTAGTFKSNIFKLQVDELLEQIRPRQGQREKQAEETLHVLKKCIEQLPARGALPVDQAERKLLSSKIAIPFPDPRPPRDARYKLEYAKPPSINVVGSHVLKTSSRKRDALEVDMLVQMPSQILQEKDFMNYRYFYKRAYYLACLAEGLKTSKVTSQYRVQYELLHGDQLKPVISVSPKSDEQNKDAKPARRWKIFIVPAVAPDAFPADKLLPGRNCVRSQSEDAQDPTPFYNASLRADMLLAPYLKLLHGAATSCAAYRDACLLGSMWLRQRDLDSSITKGGFGNFEWGALIALMLQGGGAGGKPILSPGYSSYQLLKAALQMLATRDLSKHALVIGDDSKSAALTLVSHPAIWDATRSHNVLYKVSAWSWQILRQEAVSTLSMLGDQLFDGFNTAFITNSSGPLYRYDHIAEIVLPAKANKGDLLKMLYDVLRRGLGDRVRLVNLIWSPTPAWSLGSSVPSSQATSSVKVGMVVNPDTVNRTVDLGPPAQEKAEAASFRKFWGELAELRRFKDGSILESIVWDTRGGASILQQIVQALLLRHFGEVSANTLKFAGDEYVNMLRHRDNKEPFQALQEAYKQLESDIRSLDDLPLTIRQIMPADAQLRNASLTPPALPKQSPEPANITLQFEGSARWPDDLVAIQRTKIAFLLKIGESLSDANDSITSRIGLENEQADTLNQAFLDVIYDSGVAFRLRIHHDREQTLLERQLKDKSVDPKSKELAAVGLAMFKRDYVRTPAHTQAVARLCNKYPALSGAMRLTKKWFASHLLANHFAEEVVELMTLRTFTQPWPYQTPSSATVGFLRTLRWLSKWDWRSDPLIVDLSGSCELKQQDARGIQTRFEAWRKLDPAMNRVCLFVASNVDPEGSTYTDGKPAKVVAGRATALAKAACDEAESKGFDLEPTALFSSPLEDFDIVLHLNPQTVGGAQGRKQKPVFKNLELATLDDTSTIGFEPAASFVEELERTYGHAVLFFHGSKERSVVTGLWSPQTAPRSWKVNLAYSSIAMEGKGGEDVQAVANKQAMLSEMARLGGELVKTIQVNR
ncbi:Nrap protein [Polychaeton citri CBS 116435]|uniref:U3 small nucleolar RNA-associated protein 22 n=1 Tax=Polychaeton citri CBS 116435 TaxID=1314669 RepID=A0A9P4UPI2_9PEZI|nr:Nrap protein [Polychaeton citri CBS 116435]